MADLRGHVVTEMPRTRYTKMSDGGSIAYETVGGGPLDLLVLGALTVPMDLLWDEPGLVRVRDRLSTFSRNIWMDFRGWGASERDVSPQLALDEVEQITA